VHLYHGKRKGKFSNNEVTTKLCLSSKIFQIKMEENDVRIIQEDMRLIKMMWMIILRDNMVPNKHISNMTIPNCYLTYPILKDKFLVYINGIIYTKIHHFVIDEPSKKPKNLRIPYFHHYLGSVS